MRTINPLSTNPTKWSNTLKQFVGNLSTNCLSVFDHFVGLVKHTQTIVYSSQHQQQQQQKQRNNNT